MKNSETLTIEAKEIMSLKLKSCKHDIKANSVAGKLLRKVFVSNCIAGIGEQFINSIAPYKIIESVHKPV